MAVRKQEKKAVQGEARVKTTAEKPIGVITHYYGGIGVAIVKFTKSMKAGTMLAFRGHTTNFTEVISSMQYDHKSVERAEKGKEIGIKVGEKVREGDEVFEA